MEGGGVWPLSYPVGGPLQYQGPHRTMEAHLDPLLPDYGLPNHVQDPLSPYSGPPQYGPHTPYHGPSSPYFPGDQALPPAAVPYSLGPSHGDVFQPHNPSPQHQPGSFWQPPPPGYPIEPGQFFDDEEDDEDEEDEEDESVILDLDEALQEVNIQLPRLAVTAPPSVLAPKGRGLCRLPNLGNTCYLNAVLQCFYYTPGLPALLAQACKELRGGGKGRDTVAQALNSLMTKMDDVKKLKKGVLAYFKGVCGLRDDQFASEKQQEAHDLLAGLLQWLHQDLAKEDDVECACTKGFKKKRSAAAKDKKKRSGPPGTAHHPHQPDRRPPKQPPLNGYHYQPPAAENCPPNYDIYTGSNHNYNHNHHHQQHLLEEDRMEPQERYHSHQQAPKKRSKAGKAGREGEVCGQCGVTFQRRSLISDLFEGISQQDIICPREGIIVNTTWERFTSISLPVSGSAEITLEEALQQYFRISVFMWDCDYCRSTHPCHQQVRLLCAPPVLVLHLSRYTDRRNPRKQSVLYPLDGVSLQDHMKFTKDRAKQYVLYGVCNHHGTAQQGHYTACCRANRGQNRTEGWFEFDDEEVSSVTHFRHPREAHILFYSTQKFEAMHT